MLQLTKFRWLLRCAALLLLLTFITFACIHPPVTLQIGAGKIAKFAGQAYSTSFDYAKRFGLKLEPDRPGEGQDAVLTLMEDGKPIGTPLFPLAQITANGGGRYLHSGNIVYFSSKDGSDPRTSGHKYSVIGKIAFSKSGLIIFGFASAIFSALALAQWLAASERPWPTAVSRTLRRAWLWFYINGVRESGFPLIQNAQSEHLKINVLRILFGLIVAYRSYLTAYAAYWYYEPTHVMGTEINIQFLGCIFVLLLSCLYTIGLCTPFTGVLLLLTYAALDRFLGIPNLGLCVFLVLLITFVFSNAGQMLSVDQMIARRSAGALHTFITRQYDMFGFAKSRQLSFYYFLTFVSYALTSMGAVFFHLQDYFWLHGHTVASIMTSSYICYQYQFFRNLEARFPQVLLALSMSAVVFQTIFQLFMIPLMRASWGRIFVIAWGGVFILLSATCLQLSFLPFLEMVLWLLLFCPARYFVQVFAAIDKAFLQTRQITGKQQAQWLPIGTLAVALLTWVIYPLHFPVGDKQPLFRSLRTATKPLNDAFFYLGCWVPCVFNKEDLSMSDCWITITRHFNGKDELVPLSASDGSRLRYHHFDPLYFGNQVVWRRSLRLLPNEEIIKRHKPDGFNYRLIEKVINFDYRSNCLEENPVAYVIRIYKSNSLNDTVQGDLQSKYAGKCIYSYRIAVLESTAYKSKLEL